MIVVASGSIMAAGLTFRLAGRFSSLHNKRATFGSPFSLHKRFLIPTSQNDNPGIAVKLPALLESPPSGT